MNLRDEWKTQLESKKFCPRVESLLEGVPQTANVVRPLLTNVLKSMDKHLLERLEKEQDQISLYHQLRVFNANNLPDVQSIAGRQLPFAST